MSRWTPSSPLRAWPWAQGGHLVPLLPSLGWHMGSPSAPAPLPSHLPYPFPPSLQPWGPCLQCSPTPTQAPHGYAPTPTSVGRPLDNLNKTESFLFTNCPSWPTVPIFKLLY